MTDLALASEFPAGTEEAWTALVDRVLKGKDFERALVGRTSEGLRIAPLYPKAEDPVPVLRGPAAPWHVAARIDHPDAAEANALALQDLEGGADMLILSLAGAPAARGFGLDAPDRDALARAFAGIMPDLVAVAVETAPFRGRQAAELVAGWAAGTGLVAGALSIDFGLDPIGDMMRAGGSPLAPDDLLRRMAGLAGTIRSWGHAGTIVRVDGRPIHEAGAADATELAALLAGGTAYLRALEADGWTLDDARSALSFTVVADTDQIGTVAKLRALRRLWADVETACGLAPRPVRIHAETAWRSAARRDPWVNLLRGTMAAFSAGIAGADSVAVLPFTAALGLPDAFARRLARTTQLLLLEEANLWRVADPVAGSGTFETRTEDLAAEAWAQFTATERDGGIVAVLRDGSLASRIAATSARRAEAAATRREPITGTSEFPDIREAPVAVLMPAPVRSEPAGAPAHPVASLPSRRVAEPFEALRDRSDATLAATGRRPRVFLANLGPIAAFSARTTFAKNFFEAGGVEAIGNDGFADHAALVQAFRASGCRIACLCSSDEVYEAEAADAGRVLKEAGARAVYLAGRPGSLAETLAAVSVTRFVAVGSDVLAVTGEAQDLAGA